ncbi:hypothetical protein HOLleu_33274 [Holothuria leucospilota]|uniref:Uncharacterized protein n=1 Tax=Holothuria leucospilota TaxID=206669 RepID=A0A9Q1BFA9_HOLLE|nr:hypothetical protein HOLleu_33274 [Holothuria leucospilota]
MFFTEAFAASIQVQTPKFKWVSDGSEGLPTQPRGRFLRPLPTLVGIDGQTHTDRQNDKVTVRQSQTDSVPDRWTWKLPFRDTVPTFHHYLGHKFAATSDFLHP